MIIRSVRVEAGGGSYDVLVGPGAWSGLAPLLQRTVRASRAAIVTDETVDGLYGDAVSEAAESCVPCFTHRVPVGETTKSLVELERLCRRMAAEGMDRSSVVIALGGGVVGDLAGFAASVFLRGIRIVGLPTSLLAMVDSSVGGKTGVNLPEGKNLVGTFHQPSGVIADTRTLATLSERDWYSGLAEVVKIALTLDPELFEYLEGVTDFSPKGPLDHVRIIHSACARKAEVVRADEREGGARRVLNFGHTLAHAVEAALGYGALRHGEAVVLGMRAAVRLSREKSGLSPSEEERALSVLGRIPVPRIPIPEGLSCFMERDKKSAFGAIHAVTIEKIGRPRIGVLSDPEEFVRAFTDGGFGI